jgi:hypothetical protein
MGGGFGALSKKYGSAAANVVEVEVILASGDIVTANACGKWHELFWASRGGGGGMFAVTTSVTYLTHPLPQNMGDCQGSISAFDEASFLALLEQMLLLIEQGLGGPDWGGQVYILPGFTVSLWVTTTLNHTAAHSLLSDGLFDWAAAQPQSFYVTGSLQCTIVSGQCYWDPSSTSMKAAYVRSIIPGGYTGHRGE